MQPIFALIDCNNFFVSCERIFRPDLEGKPVVVLSNNDGCAVARSNEVKALGVPMAAPAYKYRQLFKDHGVVQFSANFELYGDVSHRIVEILTEVTPRTEVYSVDESFLDLSQLHITDYEAWGRALKDRIWREVGIPISMGIAPTKTLAKLASDKPKKDPALQGVLSLLDPMDRIHHLGKTEIQDIWGVGWRLSPRLRASGVATALDLANMRPTHAQQLMGIHGRQMVYELNGTTCYPLEREEKPRQSIARTRTFGHDTSAFHDLEAALASFATQAAYRLRRSNQLTRQMGIFIMTNKHKPGLRSWDRQTRFSMPTADTGTLINAAIDLLKEVYDPRQTYHRAGVWLYDFLPASHLQTDFFEEINAQVHEQSMRRMQAVDDINARFGKRHLRYATEDLGTTWQSKQSIRSPRYTSSWEDLPKARIFY